MLNRGNWAAVVKSELFPPLEPFSTGMLQVDELHQLYWEQSGNPEGRPILFLHGGPGAGCSAGHRRFFDPDYYRIILFDQRGAGRSTPSGSLEFNTTAHLISDIERLRIYLGISQWLIFGGSWGSTLALAYGQAKPENCLGFILRGIFLSSAAEIDWFLGKTPGGGVQRIFPEAYQAFVDHVSGSEDRDILDAYYKRLTHDDVETQYRAAAAWCRYERACSRLNPAATENDTLPAGIELAMARIEAHYMKNLGFLQPSELLENMKKLNDCPSVIVQGRYDIICPSGSAYALASLWPSADFRICEESGHSASEPGIGTELVRATEHFKHCSL